tara:strand:- start:20760 stop:20897 length:138 start_codon:yes stop_codon:yes gene_type:complete
METKGERRERKRQSKKKKVMDNRKSVSLIIDILKKRTKLKKPKSK